MMKIKSVIRQVWDSSGGMESLLCNKLHHLVVIFNISHYSGPMFKLMKSNKQPSFCYSSRKRKQKSRRDFKLMGCKSVWFALQNVKLG